MRTTRDGAVRGVTIAVAMLLSSCVTGLYRPVNGWGQAFESDVFRFKLGDVRVLSGDRLVVSMTASNLTLKPQWFHRDLVSLRSASGKTYTPASATVSGEGELPKLFDPHSGHELSFQFNGISESERARIWVLLMNEQAVQYDRE